VHLHVNENDVIKPCCYGNNIKQFPADFDYAIDPDFQRIRSDMLAGRPVKECQIVTELRPTVGRAIASVTAQSG